MNWIKGCLGKVLIRLIFFVFLIRFFKAGGERPSAIPSDATSNSYFILRAPLATNMCLSMYRDSGDFLKDLKALWQTQDRGWALLIPWVGILAFMLRKKTNEPIQIDSNIYAMF